ncbi:MAG: hypothetical protein KC729_21810, partial [Candidatus Eisenbacteria bacterium]|nr:hypothetical protein [Candidatus Eisenbacteria bacterium]
PVDNPETGAKYRLQLVTTLINMTGLYAQQRLLDQGLASAEEALGLLEGLDGPANSTKLLRIGALQNKATLHLELRQLPEAEAALRGAVELGAELMAGGAPQLLPQAVDASGRLVGVLRALKRPEEAVPIAERSARWAEAAYEAGSPIGPQLYVGTQLQLVDVYFATDAFAQAEDHLWKAVDIGGDGRTMTMATGFYFSLLKYDDRRLEAGDLPRPEVLEALTELMERVAEKEIPPEIADLIRGRYAVLADRKVEIGEATIARHETSDAAAIRQLVGMVRQDVDFVRGTGT